jgi:exopolysaccharide production protein ExoQ
MQAIGTSRADALGVAATVVLGVLLPLVMAFASKSSPLLLGISAILAAAAALAAARPCTIRTELTGFAASPWVYAAAVLIALMAVSCFWAHDTGSSLNQFVQFLVPALSGVVLALAFPRIAAKNRTLWWLAAAGLTGLIVTVDIKTGLMLRHVTGGRMMEYIYNRTIVTLVLLSWPLLALAIVRGQWAWLALLLPVPVSVFIGESQTAVLGLLIGVAVFPIAKLLPGLTSRLGLAVVLITLAISPFFGTLAKQGLGANFHKTMEAAHSDDRVNIWLSFEAAAQRKWLLGNGFGSSLNLQNAAVAKQIPPERVTLLGASHPHNAFLQLWVELGAVGAALSALLFIALFQAIDRADQRLRPYMLTWIAVVCGIALVSHGAWQAWWVAAIAASAASFLAIQRELAAPL